VVVLRSYHIQRDYKLFIAIDCRRGSLIKLHRLMWIKILWSAHFCWPEGGGGQYGNSTAGHPQSSPTPLLPLSSTWTGRMLSEQSTKNKQSSIWCDHWSSCCKVSCVCVLDGVVSPCPYLSPTGHLFGAFRWHQSNDRLWDNYRRSTLSVGLRVGLWAFV